MKEERLSEVVSKIYFTIPSVPIAIGIDSEANNQCFKNAESYFDELSTGVRHDVLR